MLRSLSVALLIVGSVFGIVGLSQNAAAISVDYYFYRGYAGNSTIYLNTEVVGTMPISVISDLPVATGSQPQQPLYDNVNNVVNLIVGSGRATPSGTMQFQETFMGAGSNYLYVVIPVTALGATRMFWTVARPSQPATADTSFLAVSVSGGDVSSPNAPGGRWMVQVNTDTLYNSGVNVTGRYNKGGANANWQSLASLALDVGCYIIPGYDFVCLTLSQMLNLFGVLSGVNYGPTDFLGNGNSYLEYGVIGGGSPVNTPAAPHGEAKNVFATDMLLKVQIPYDPIANQFPFNPTFTLGATNWIHDPNWYYSGYRSLVIGANASATLRSVPSVLISGSIYAGGETLKNYDVALSQTYTDGPVITRNYHLKTDQNGVYRFFGELNKLYTLQASYATSFGTVTAYASATTPNSPNSLPLDLVLPTSKIHGYVKTAGGSAIPGAPVTTTSPSGSTYTTTSDSSGHYSVWGAALGTYNLAASASGYASQTRSVNVGSFNAAYQVPDFALNAYPRIGGSVKDSGGSAISGAGVKATSPSGGTYAASTSVGGDYSLTVTELGTYSLTASKCGYIVQTKSVSVSAFDSVYRVDFSLSLYSGVGNIAPIYVTASGAAKQGAFVTVSSCNGATVYSATTDAAGMVSGKTDLAAGLYTVTASWTDWSTCTGGPGEVHWIWMGSVTVEIPPNKSPTVATSPHHSVRCPT
jgi:hypothetical protein